MSTRKRNFLAQQPLYGDNSTGQCRVLSNSGQKSGQIATLFAPYIGICIGVLHMSSIFRYKRIEWSPCPPTPGSGRAIRPQNKIESWVIDDNNRLVTTIVIIYFAIVIVINIAGMNACNSNSYCSL
jgi:hypothetical protein